MQPAPHSQIFGAPSVMSTKPSGHVKGKSRAPFGSPITSVGQYVLLSCTPATCIRVCEMQKNIMNICSSVWRSLQQATSTRQNR